MRRPTIKSVLGIVTALCLVGSASAWLAATGSGAGQGAANVTMQDVTLSAAAPAGKLYPGSSAAVAATISNPNASAAHVASLVLDTAQSGGFDVDQAHADAGCNADAVLTYTAQNAGWTVPADGSAPVTLADAVTLAESAPNACQGATFTVYLKAGA